MVIGEETTLWIDANCGYGSKDHSLSYREIWFRDDGLYTMLLKPYFELTRTMVIGARTTFWVDANCGQGSMDHSLSYREIWFLNDGLYTMLLKPYFELTRIMVIGARTAFWVDANRGYGSKDHSLSYREIWFRIDRLIYYTFKTVVWVNANYGCRSKNHTTLSVEAKTGQILECYGETEITNPISRPLIWYLLIQIQISLLLTVFPRMRLLCFRWISFFPSHLLLWKL